MRTILIIASISMLILACGGPERRQFHGGSAGHVYIDPPDIQLEGDRIAIDDHIHFAHDSDEILAESTELLDRIAEFLKHHPEITALNLVGHTDSTGSPAHNLDLSTRRAASVRAALEQRGVPQTVDSRGAGMTEPLCQEDTDECRQRNRLDRKSVV